MTKASVNKSRGRWRSSILLAGFVAIGVAASYFAGEKLERDARETWLSHANADVLVATDAAQSRINQVFLALRAMAVQFGPEIELDSSDLEVAASKLEDWNLDIYPKSVAFAWRVTQERRNDAELRLGKKIWVYGDETQPAPDIYETFPIAATSDSTTGLALGVDLASNVGTHAVVSSAYRTPGDVTMGPAFRATDGSLCTLIGTTVRNGDEQGILVASIDLVKFVRDFTSQQTPEGLRLRLSERETKTTEESLVRNLIGGSAPYKRSAKTYTVRLSNGQAKWDLHWDVMPDYRGGPRIGTADTVRYGGLIATVIAVIAFAMMLAENSVVSRRVEERTRELKQQRSFLELILGNISDPMAVADATRRITRINKAFTRDFGYTQEEIEGRDGALAFADDAEFERVGRDIPDGSEVTGDAIFEARFRRKNGEIFLGEMVRSAIIAETGHLVGYVSVVRDISARKQVEEEMRHAMEAAESGNRAKSEFLANMSHEIRTPLNAIIGFSDIILSSAFGDIGNPRYADYVNDIHHSGQHLLSIINDILDISKIEAGSYKLVLEQTDVADPVLAALRIVNEQVRNAGLILETRMADDLPMVSADPTAVSRMLINLLSNAAKFTPAGGTVTVETGHGDDGSVVLSISDTGVGVRDEDIERILTPFGQVASAMSRDHQGTGLGLPITKWLIEQHGGRFELESEETVGTRVSLIFPSSLVVAQPDLFLRTETVSG
ncbi:MAG: PAS domain-containing sensor histidine kinase [Rhodospirillaceae bacterium]|nr:PAS domain-containing sensor histidine kinase [Rhodospirillaceae bacterium]